MKKKLMITALVLVAVFCGYILGNVIVNKINGQVDYSKYSESTLRDNEETIYANYKSGKIKYDSLKSSDAATAYIITSMKIKDASYVKINGKGSVQAAIANQNILDYFEKTSTGYKSETLSSGFIKIADKTEYNSKSDKLTLYKGSLNADGTSATYNNNGKTYTSAEYKKEFGVTPGELLHHIISSKTITTATIKTTANGKQFTMTMDPISCVINYVKLMSKTSNTSYPTFNHVIITFEIDKNFNLLRYSTDEEYVVNYGFSVVCKSVIDFSVSYKK